MVICCATERQGTPALSETHAPNVAMATMAIASRGTQDLPRAPARMGCSTKRTVNQANRREITTADTRRDLLGTCVWVMRANDNSGQCQRYHG